MIYAIINRTSGTVIYSSDTRSECQTRRLVLTRSVPGSQYAIVQLRREDIPLWLSK